MRRLVTERRRFAIVLLAATILSGCAAGLLPKADAPLEQYLLHDLQSSSVATTGRRGHAAGPWTTLLVGEPHALPGFDTQQIVYVRDRDRLDSFALSRWVGPPARMLGPLLVAAIDRSGTFDAVLGAPTAAIGTWRLDTELIRLQQDFTSAPSRVRLTLRVVLIETASRRVVASRMFDATVISSSDDTAGGVTAANQAVEEVLAGVVSFCTEAVRPQP